MCAAPKTFPLASQSGHLRSCVAPSIRTVQPTAGSGRVSLLRLQSLPHPLQMICQCGSHLRGRSRSFRLHKSDETALQTPAVPKYWQVRHAPSSLRSSRRRTLTALAFSRNARPGLRPGLAQVPVRKDLSATRFARLEPSLRSGSCFLALRFMKVTRPRRCAPREA